MYADPLGPPMFETLHRWVVSLLDLGDGPDAVSAAQALCREARTTEEMMLSDRLLADACERIDDLDGARVPRERLVQLTRRLFDLERTTERRVELLEELDLLGELARRQGDHWTVLECHGNHGRLAELRELIAVHGRSEGLLAEYSYSLRRAGGAARDMGSLEEARSLFVERLATARLVAAVSPGEPRRVALVVAALADLGAVLTTMGDLHAGGLIAEERQLRQWLSTQRGWPGSLSEADAGLPGADTEEHLFTAGTLLTAVQGAAVDQHP